MKSIPTSNHRVLLTLMAGILFLSFSLVPGCTGKKEDGLKTSKVKDQDLLTAPRTTVVMTVGDTEVNLHEINGILMKMVKELQSEGADEEAAQKVLARVIERNSLYLEAVQRKINIDPDIWKKWEFYFPIWVGDYYSALLAVQSTPDDAVVNALLPAEAFVFKVHQITLKDLTAAVDIRNRVVNGEDFEDLAKRYSIDPVASKGGKLNDFLTTRDGRMYDDDVIDILAKTTEGEISSVVKQPMGYTFFRLDSKRPFTEKEWAFWRRKEKQDIVANAMRALEQKLTAKYPMIIDLEILDKAITDNNDNLVIGTVGDFDITFQFAKNLISSFPWTRDRPTLASSPEKWRDYIRTVNFQLAYYEQARQDGILEDPVVKENLARIKKDSLIDSFIQVLWEEFEPTDSALYAWYLNHAGPQTAEAFFSVEGFRDLDRGEAESLAAALEGGKSLKAAQTAAGIDPAVEPVSGSFREGEFRPGELLALEKTPAGKTTPLILTSSDSRYAVYRVTAKNRGNMPPFDELYDQMKREFWEDEFKNMTKEIVESRGGSPRYIYDRSAIMELIDHWYRQTAAPPPGHENLSPH